jgi:putative transcriptional regulator
MEHQFIKSLNPQFESLEGKVLIATTSLDGSFFERGLIFICSHSKQGAVGVMFNKKIDTISCSQMPAADKSKKNLVPKKKFPLFSGGPVEEDGLLILSASKEQKQQFSKVQSLKLFTNAEGFISDVIKGKNKDKFIILRGFCGWTAGQLEAELIENSWVLMVSDFKLIFSTKPEKQWDNAIKKIGIKNIQKFKDLVSYTGNA